MSDIGERNHEATPLRRQQARANGDIPQSAELAASLSMLGAIGAGYLTFGPPTVLPNTPPGLW